MDGAPHRAPDTEEITMEIVSMLVAGTAALGLAGGAVIAGLPAAADGVSGPGAGSEQRQARLDLACERLPQAVRRTENLTKRLAGDAGARGSLAWLQATADRAEAAGRDDLAALLSSRLAVRQDLAALLPGRLDLLAQAQELCEQRDAGSAA